MVQNTVHCIKINYSDWSPTKRNDNSAVIKQLHISYPPIHTQYVINTVKGSQNSFTAVTSSFAQTMEELLETNWQKKKKLRFYFISLKVKSLQ